jgi:flagellar biosynthesis chaperone FliJ
VLSVLERYRTLILEEAQNVHVRCAQVLDKESATHTLAEEALQSAYAAHRSALVAPGQSLSPEALSSSYHHARNQSEALEQARTARDRAQKRFSQAQDSLSARLEELKVIERLRDRRSDSVSKEQRRRAQGRLDELGISKTCQAEGRWPSAE